LQITDKLDEELLYALLRENVRRNPMIYGSAIAYDEYQYDSERRLFSPYVFGHEDLTELEIGSQAYDYTDDKWEWFAKAKKLGKPVWTEPYFDEGAGNILMDTFSVPFFKEGKFQGVATIDIPLDKLQKTVVRQYLADKQPFVIISAKGRFITHPLPEKILQGTIQQTAAESDDPAFKKLADRLLSGQTGVTKIDSLELISKEPFWVFYAPIESTGWMFSTAVKEAEILKYLNKQIGRGIFGVGILVLLVIVSILWVSNRITKPIMSLAKVVTQLGEGDFSVKIEKIKTEDEISDLAKAFNQMVQQLNHHIRERTREASAREAVESELRVAREIQASLLPDTFPVCPNENRIDMYAVNEPAKQVGGDFFDYFFISDNQLIFVIADVSGKGTPAAIVMAVARTIIRNLARSCNSPAKILLEMNRLLVEIQKHPVFVTVFIGVYATDTGKITYANAGHQPPYILKADGTINNFGEATGTIVGMLDDAEYDEREAYIDEGDYLIAYTDGIPDARSPNGLFYGENHFVNLLLGCVGVSAKEICDLVISEIEAYQAMNLADDITVLVIKRCE